MKPNYCSGGAFASGRISSSSSSSNHIYKNDNGNNERINLGEQRQQQLNQRGNSSLNYSTSASPFSPNFIVYRSAKYISPHARILRTLRTYAKFYVAVPIVLFANRCKDIFYQLFGLFLLLVLSPLWIMMFIGLFITKRLRHLLIRRLYPSLVHLEGYNSQLSPSSSPIESHGIVNSIIWIKGKIDVNIVKQRFMLLFAENSHVYNTLQLKQVSKFGAKLWETCPDFQLDNHVVEAQKTFHNFPLVDEPLKELYRTGSHNKSILQKYVSYCVSLPLNCEHPPWKVHIVSYVSRDDGVREKTCLVIRMHVALIRISEVQRALRELFLNSSLTTDESVTECSNDSGIGVESSEMLPKENDNIDVKVGILDIRSVLKYVRGGDIWRKLKKVGLTQQKHLTVWINLRLKQLEFHSKTVVLSIIFMDAKDAFRRFLCTLELLLYEAFISAACFFKSVITILQAIVAVPMFIFMCLIKKRHFKGLGLQKHSIPGKKLICWSDMIHGNLAEEICEKIGTSSPENVMLMACLHALRDYYQQNNMTVPRKIGFVIGNEGNAIEPSQLRKAISLDVASPHKNVYGRVAKVEELLNLEEKILNYPKWKTLALLYISNYSNYFLPTSIVLKLQQSIVSTYPFLFTHVNLKSASTCGQDLLPIPRVFGEAVEDFTFWPLPPMSDLGISITLVRCTGKTRLFVLSPFQSMDTILTHRCNQYLIKLAEDVGIDKGRIPYSRRSSPSSTNCSTPQIPSYYINPVELGFRSCLQRSETSINAI